MHQIRKQDELNSLTSKHPLVIVNFTASWCGPCQTVDPLFDEHATKNPEIVFAKVNVDEDGGISDSFNIGTTPTFVTFWQGQCVDRYTGSKPGGLVKLIDELRQRKE